MFRGRYPQRSRRNKATLGPSWTRKNRWKNTGGNYHDERTQEKHLWRRNRLSAQRWPLRRQHQKSQHGRTRCALRQNTKGGGEEARGYQVRDPAGHARHRPESDACPVPGVLARVSPPPPCLHWYLLQEPGHYIQPPYPGNREDYLAETYPLPCTRSLP